MTEEKDLFELKKEKDESFEVLNRSSFAVIPVEIIEDVSISAQALRIYCYMRSKVGRWKFYNKDIMQKLDIKSDHSMAKYLKELLDSGWVTRSQNLSTEGGFSGYHYEVLEKKEEDEQIVITKNFPFEEIVNRMSKNDNRAAKTRMSKNDNLSSCSKDNINNIKEKYIKEKILFDENKQPILTFLDQEVLKPIFLKYFFYRKDVIKKPFKTITGVEEAFKKLKKLSKNQETIAEEIFNKSVEREWIGLFAIGTGSGGNRRFVVDSKNEDYKNIGHRID